VKVTAPAVADGGEAPGERRLAGADPRLEGGGRGTGSTPAACSLSSALPVAPASGADCHSRAARPSAAASSGSSTISGSS
jgi:hypothetical protein